MNPKRTASLLAAAVLALVSVILVVACTSSGDEPSSDDDACSALAACCSTLTGAQAQTCQSTLKGIEDDGNSSQCATTFATYQSAGQCGGDAGLGFDANVDVNAPSSDGAASCTLLGTCPPQDDGSVGPGFDAGAGRTCQVTGSCNDASVETCTATLDGGACAAAVVIENGPAFGCAACGDCTNASTLAAQYCQEYLTPDAGAD